MPRARIAAILLLLPSPSFAQSYPDDDGHNHDGSHPSAPTNCGTNYMLPGLVARLGSHSFMILGKDGDRHVIASHRSGTPPHNYQFLLRVRLDDDELEAYRSILTTSKTLPAFTTIDYDPFGKQKGRTFFCLADLPKIFGAEKKKGDAFAKLFPVRASLQKDADHEGSFEILKSVVPGATLSIERDDVELLVYRYLPAYLPQDELRKAIKERPQEVLPLTSHAPTRADEPPETAAKRASYIASDGLRATAGKTCPKNFYLKKTTVPETIHTFLLLAEVGTNKVLATHYYDQAPQNFQTVVELTLSDVEMQIWRLASKDAAVPLFQTTTTFCMENLRALVETNFVVKGTVFEGSKLDDYRLGKAIGTIELAGSDIEVFVNRRLESLLSPLAVAEEVRNAQKSKGG